MTDQETTPAQQEAHDCEDYATKLVPATERGDSMNRVCAGCGKLIRENVPATTFEGLIRKYIHGMQGRKTVAGNYRIINDGKALIYRGKGRNNGFGDDTLAIKLKDGRIIGNASKLDRCGSYRRGIEAPAQQVMMKLAIPLIPFNVFEEAKLEHPANVRQDFLARVPGAGVDLPGSPLDDLSQRPSPVEAGQDGDQQRVCGPLERDAIFEDEQRAVDLVARRTGPDKLLQAVPLGQPERAGKDRILVRQRGQVVVGGEGAGDAAARGVDPGPPSPRRQQQLGCPSAPEWWNQSAAVPAPG
jgi:hypothetical protein